MTQDEMDNLHDRIAAKLGWTRKEVQGFSLPTLREMVREKYPKLAHLITQAMRGAPPHHRRHCW